MKILRMGSRGPSVELLQLALVRAGFGPLDTDGLFGPLTEAALRRFQSAEGLTADGIAGRETHRALLPWYTGYRIHRIVPGDTFWTRYPNGDGYHIYPPRKGAKDGALSASLRLCAIRDGVEEHTYLEKLSALAADKTAGESARKAAALCDEYRTLVPIPNAGGRYSSKILPEPEVLDRLRNRAGELLSASGKGED